MQWVALGPLEALKEKGSLAGHGVVAFWHEDALRVVDNRCPHMGFPLSKGTVSKGILTCHWHSWQFDLQSGGCLTPLEADLAVYPSKVENGQVLVNLRGADKSAMLEGARRRFACALNVASTLEGSKACYRLLKEGDSPAQLVRQALELSLRYRGEFTAGLVSLTALARVMQDPGVAFTPEERVLGLMQGVAMVAGESQGSAPRRPRPALPGEAPGRPRLEEWFRGFIEDRETFAAERVLRTAAAEGAGEAQLAGMLLTAATDHLFIGEGHIVDFINKALELGDIAGKELSPEILSSLLRGMVDSARHEEEMAWKHPVDLASLIPAAQKRVEGLDPAPTRHEAFDAWEWAEFLNACEPEAGLDFIAARFGEGWGLGAVARALGCAAILRMHRFHTRNEFFDWDSLHHAFTHANAFWRLSLRVPSQALMKNAFQLYGYLYLTRFLNLPKAPLPEEHPAPDKADLARLIESRDVDGAASAAFNWLAQGRGAGELKKALALAALREDHGFHSWQQLEAAFSMNELLGSDPHASRPLSSLARWLAAHSPTPRSLNQTVENAIRLERGDKLYED